MSGILQNGRIKQQLGKRDDNPGEHLQAGSLCRTGDSPADKPVCDAVHAEAGKGRRKVSDKPGRNGTDVSCPGMKRCPDCGTYITLTTDKYRPHICAQLGARRVRHDEQTLEDYRLKMSYGLYLMGVMDIDRLEEYLNSTENDPVELYEARYLKNARR